MKSSLNVADSRGFEDLSYFTNKIVLGVEDNKGKINSRLGFAYFIAIVTCVVIIFL